MPGIRKNRNYLTLIFLIPLESMTRWNDVVKTQMYHEETRTSPHTVTLYNVLLENARDSTHLKLSDLLITGQPKDNSWPVSSRPYLTTWRKFKETYGLVITIDEAAWIDGNTSPVLLGMMHDWAIPFSIVSQFNNETATGMNCASEFLPQEAHLRFDSKGKTLDRLFHPTSYAISYWQLKSLMASPKKNIHKMAYLEQLVAERGNIVEVLPWKYQEDYAKRHLTKNLIFGSNKIQSSL